MLTVLADQQVTGPIAVEVDKVGRCVAGGDIDRRTGSGDSNWNLEVVLGLGINNEQEGQCSRQECFHSHFSYWGVEESGHDTSDWVPNRFPIPKPSQTMINTRLPVFTLFCLVAGGCASSTAEESAAPPSDDVAVNLLAPSPAGELPVTHRLPADWLGEESTSSMRLAQYRIASDSDVVCVVFWFGAGAGGSLQANFDRWTQQFADGATIASEEIDVADRVRASVLEVRGRYVAEVTPGAAERHDEPDWAMLAAYLDVPEGPLFLRLVGPSAEVVAQREAFVAWIRSFQVVTGA